MSAKQAFDLFDDPRSWAMDYKERWITAKRMRLNVRAHSMVVQGKCNREDMMADLWNIWFMLTENGESALMRRGIHIRVMRRVKAAGLIIQTARTFTF
jgi:hypothetical protein